MKQKTAIVTGGNAGLGYAIAKKFCENNIKTYIIGRSSEKTEQAAKDMGPNAVPLILDVTHLDKLPAIITQIEQDSGSIDILVNNAGINQKKEFLEVTNEDFTNILNTNVLSVFAISREVAKVMHTQGGGAIVNISSMAAQYGIPKVIAYSASKTAIEGMTRAMAVDLAQYNIRVNCVAPGFIKTNMSSKALDSDPERKQKVLGRTPLGKLGLPEDIADAVFYLASDQAKYTTGIVMPVDGGNCIGF